MDTINRRALLLPPAAPSAPRRDSAARAAVRATALSEPWAWVARGGPPRRAPSAPGPFCLGPRVWEEVGP
jgi:hypothetical protein